jgi:YD repeat-containing protein
VIIAVDGPDGMRMNFYYDEFGNLVEAYRDQDDDNSRVETYRYELEEPDPDLRNKLRGYSDANGAETVYDYSEGELVVSQDSIVYRQPMAFVIGVTEPEGGFTQFDFAKLNGTETTTVTDARNHPTSYTMNDYGSVLTIVDPAGTTRMTWADDDVLMKSRTDANGVRTTYEHDEHGNVVEETVSHAGLSYRITRSYADILGKPWIKNRVATETDRNGNTTTYSYDDRANSKDNGNLTRIVDAENNVTIYDYDPLNGDRIFERDPNGNVTRYEYDLYGNLAVTTGDLTDTTGISGYRIETEWDVRSRPTKRIDANGIPTRFEYDNLDRLVVRTDAYGNSREFTYDPVGNKLSESDEEHTDAKPRTTQWTYDRQNRVLSETDALGNSVGYTYDLVGNRKSMTDRRGNPTGWDYDAANRMIRQTEPLGKVTEFGYDPVGNLVRKIDAERRETRYEYDLLNRRTRIVDAEDNITYIAYDGVNRTSQTDPLAPGLPPTRAPDQLRVRQGQPPAHADPAARPHHAIFLR